MAEDKLPCRRSESIVATSCDKVTLQLPAISFREFQNASSRLTLVLWPTTTIERLTTKDITVSLLGYMPSHCMRSRTARTQDAPLSRATNRSKFLALMQPVRIIMGNANNPLLFRPTFSHSICRPTTIRWDFFTGLTRCLAFQINLFCDQEISIERKNC